MSQPPSNPGQDPQRNPQHPEGNPPQQPVPGDPYRNPPEGQQYMGPDGQPYNGPTGPDGQPYNDSAQPHRGTKFGVKQIIAAVVVVVLLGVGAFFLWQNMQKDAALAVGNCLSFMGTPEDAKHELMDCDDTSVYSEYIGEVIDGEGECSDPLSSSYSTVKDGSEVVQNTCLIPQFFEGQCYVVSPEDSVNDFELVDCDGDTDFQVAKVSDEGDAQCEDVQEPISFIAPARTYCLAFSE